MLYDISPPLHPDMPIWPGDTPFARHDAWQLSDQCPVNVARLTLSGHSAAHADAPAHFLAQGLGIGQVPLAPYLGTCRVLHCLQPGALISLAHIQSALQGFSTALPPRVLLRTYQTYPLHAWDEDFPGLDPHAITWLAGQGVQLIGVDTASLDPMPSKTLAAHHAAASTHMAILEQLWLDEVAEGDYELIALPLKLLDCDASPVRAVLRDLS